MSRIIGERIRDYMEGIKQDSATPDSRESRPERSAGAAGPRALVMRGTANELTWADQLLNVK